MTRSVPLDAPPRLRGRLALGAALLAAILAAPGCAPDPGDGDDDGAGPDTAPTGDDTAPADPGPAPVAASGLTGCTDAVPTVAPGPEGLLRVTTPRVQLDSALDEDIAVDHARMLDAAFGAWETWFGPGLQTPITVTLTADAPSFEAAVSAAGDTAPPGLGGYYSRLADEVFLYEQPTPYYTRVLLLHEATHQVHQRWRTPTVAMPFWYVEGVAEHLGRHDWDGRCVALGARPLATVEDVFASALTDLPTFDPATAVPADDLPGRDTVTAWWRFLELHPDTAEAFEAWRRDADAGTVPYDSLGDVLALSELADPYDDWLHAAQLPYAIVFTDWTHTGPDALTGTGQFTTLLRLKADPPTPYTASHEAVSGDTLAGLLLGHDDASHFDAALVGADGTVWTLVDEGTGPVFSELGAVPTPLPDPVPWTWDATTGALTVAGTALSHTPRSTPAAGLAMYAGSVDFTGVYAP